MPLVDERNMAYACDSCGKLAEYFPCRVRPASAEWYCESCHKSVLVKDVLQPEAEPLSN